MIFGLSLRPSRWLVPASSPLLGLQAAEAGASLLPASTRQCAGDAWATGLRGGLASRHPTVRARVQFLGPGLRALHSRVLLLWEVIFWLQNVKCGHPSGSSRGAGPCSERDRAGTVAVLALSPADGLSQGPATPAPPLTPSPGLSFRGSGGERNRGRVSRWQNNDYF